MIDEHERNESLNLISNVSSSGDLMAEINPPQKVTVFSKNHNVIKEVTNRPFEIQEMPEERISSLEMRAAPRIVPLFKDMLL